MRRWPQILDVLHSVLMMVVTAPYERAVNIEWEFSFIFIHS